MAQRARRRTIFWPRWGCPSVADDLVSDLPYGQQKLVGVARALMGDAKCLLLDEPMAGVEGQAYAAMQRVVREVAESGVAVCVVEHNIAFVRDLCDEGVFMFAGAIMARGSVAELIRDPQLTELYFGTLSDAAGSEPERRIWSVDGAATTSRCSLDRRRTAWHFRAQRGRQDHAVALHRRRRASEPREGRCRRHRHRRRARSRRMSAMAFRWCRRGTTSSPICRSSRICASPGCCSIRRFVTQVYELFPGARPSAASNARAR